MSVLVFAAVAPAAGTPPIVRVYVAGTDAAVSGSRDAIQDLCSRSNVAVVVRDAAGADEALLATSHAPGLAEAYVDLRAGSAPRVVVVDGETRKDLERRTLPDGSTLEISIETVAQVVCAAVESSLAARAAEAPPAASSVRHEKTPDTEAPKALRPGPERSSQIDLFAAAANFGAGFRVGAGASLAVSRGRGPLRFGALLSFAGYPATNVEGEGGVASFSSLGGRLLPTLEWRANRALTAFVGVGGGVDWTRVSAEQPPPGTVGQGAGSSVDAMASAMLGVRLHLGGGVSALLALDADADLSRHQYVIQTPQGSQSFFEPARVRPIALAGLSLALDGASEPSQHNEARR
ncbi:MAG: hypothetical protein ABUL62_12515 [Myxococcales bacterium]